MEEARHIPRYEMVLEKDSHENQFKLMIRLLNRENIQETSTVNIKSVMILLVGTSLNEIIIHERYQHSHIIENSQILKKFEVHRCIDLEKIEAHFISEDWVGIDCHSELVLKESSIETRKPLQNKSSKTKDESNTTYTQMFLDMYMKIKKPLRKEQKNVSRPKKLNVHDSSERNTHEYNENLCREQTNYNGTGGKSSKSDKCHNEKFNLPNSITGVEKDECDKDQSNLPKPMPDVDKRVVEIVEEIAGSNDNFRFMSENLDIINTSSCNECDKSFDFENSFEVESYQKIDTDETTERDRHLNGETSMRYISPHCDIIPNDIEYWNGTNKGRSDNLLKSFQRNLSFGKIETCTNEHDGMDGDTDLKDPALDKKSEILSKDDNLSCKLGQLLEDVEPDLERNDRFLNTSTSCHSIHYSEKRCVEDPTYQIDFTKSDIDTSATIRTPVNKKPKVTKIVPTDLDHHIENAHELFSISRQYVDSSSQELFDCNDGNRKYDFRIGRNIDNGRKHSNFTKMNQKQDIAKIHPAEDLEDKIFREGPRKVYLDDFKRPEKKKIRHYFSDHNFPDSTIINMIPVIGIIKEQSKSQKFQNIESIHEHDNMSEYTKKSIKWRSPLVSSPALKFSPKIDTFSTTELNEIRNDVDEAFDISIISNNSRQTENVMLNSKPSQRAVKTSQQHRGTKFPLCDNDYDGISESLTSKEFFDICETSFLEDMRSKREKQTPKMFSQSKTCSATDYIRQFLKSSAATEKQVGKQGCEKTHNLSNVSSNGNRKTISPYTKHEPKRNDVSQTSFDSQDYISYCREDSENKLFGPDHMEIYQEPYSEQCDITYDRQQKYHDLISRQNNNLPIQEMSDGWPVHPSTSASHFSQPQYDIPYLNDENVNLIRSSNPGFKPRCHGLKCYQLRPYTFQNAHAYSVDSDHYKYSRPKPPGNYNYSLRNPALEHHFNNNYRMKQPLSACTMEYPRNQYFSQGDFHDARDRMKTPFKQFVGDQESMELNRISEGGALGYNLYNKPILDEYPDVNLLSQNNHISRDLNEPFVNDTYFPTNTEHYNPNVGYPYDSFHNSRISDYHGGSFIGHPRNLSRPYLHPRNYDQSFSSLGDKDYVMNRFLYSLYPQ